MQINEYQELAGRTANHGQKAFDVSLMVAGLGLAGEAGEAADVIKKHFEQDRPLDHQKLFKELGDVCWYLARVSTVMGWKLEDVMAGNIVKLKERFPDGFSTERSLNRSET